MPRTPLLGALACATAAVLLFFLGAASADSAVTRYKIDKGHSSLHWKVSHLGISNTRGRFNEFNGTFTIDDANLKNAKVEIDIDVESIDSNDEGRDKHLRGAEFFNTEKFPSMGFVSTAVTKTDAKTYRVVGNFTLLGVTKEVAIRMTKVGEGKDPWGHYRMGFDGALVIKRSDYGMTAMLKGIGDEVALSFGIEGIRMDPKPAKK